MYVNSQQILYQISKIIETVFDSFFQTVIFIKNKMYTVLKPDILYIVFF